MIDRPARGDHSQPTGEHAIVIAAKAAQLEVIVLDEC
jgi:hypothetical protein